MLEPLISAIGQPREPDFRITRVRDSKGMLLRTQVVDFMGCNIVLEGWKDPYIYTWRGVVEHCVKWDAVLILQNFSFRRSNEGAMAWS